MEKSVHSSSSASESSVAQTVSGNPNSQNSETPMSTNMYEEETEQDSSPPSSLKEASDKNQKKKKKKKKKDKYDQDSSAPSSVKETLSQSSISSIPQLSISSTSQSSISSIPQLSISSTSQSSISSTPQSRYIDMNEMGEIGCFKPLPLSPSIIPESTEIDDEVMDALKETTDYVYKSILSGNFCKENKGNAYGIFSFCRDYERELPYCNGINTKNRVNIIDEEFQRPMNVYPSHNNFYNTNVNDIPKTIYPIEKNIHQDIHPVKGNPIGFTNNSPGVIEKFQPTPHSTAISFLNDYPGQISAWSKNVNKCISYIEKSPDKVQLSMKPSPHTAGVLLLTGQSRLQKSKTRTRTIKQKTRTIADTRGNDDCKHDDTSSQSKCHSNDGRFLSNTNHSECLDHYISLNDQSYSEDNQPNENSQMSSAKDQSDRVKGCRNIDNSQCDVRKDIYKASDGDNDNDLPFISSIGKRYNVSQETIPKDETLKKDCGDNKRCMTKAVISEQHDRMFYVDDKTKDTDKYPVSITEENIGKVFSENDDINEVELISKEDLIIFSPNNEDSYSVHIGGYENIASKMEQDEHPISNKVQNLCKEESTFMTESFNENIDKEEKKDGQCLQHSHDSWVSNLLSESELLLEQIDEEIDSFSAIYTPKTSILQSKDNDEYCNETDIGHQKDCETLNLEGNCKQGEHLETQKKDEKQTSNVGYFPTRNDDIHIDGKLQTLDEMVSQNLSKFVTKEITNENDEINLTASIHDSSRNISTVNGDRIFKKKESDILFEEKKCTILSLYGTQDTDTKQNSSIYKSKNEAIGQKLFENEVECLDPQCNRFFVKHSVQNCCGEECTIRSKESQNDELSYMNIGSDQTKIETTRIKEDKSSHTDFNTVCNTGSNIIVTENGNRNEDNLLRTNGMCSNNQVPANYSKQSLPMMQYNKMNSVENHISKLPLKSNMISPKAQVTQQRDSDMHTQPLSSSCIINGTVDKPQTYNINPEGLTLANNALIQEMIAETKQSLLSSKTACQKQDQHVSIDDKSSFNKAKPISNIGCLVSVNDVNQSTTPIDTQGLLKDNLVSIYEGSMIHEEDNTTDHLLMMTSLPTGMSNWDTPRINIEDLHDSQTYQGRADTCTAEHKGDSQIKQHTTSTQKDQYSHDMHTRQSTPDSQTSEHLTSWETFSIDTVTSPIGGSLSSPLTHNDNELPSPMLQSNAKCQYETTSENDKVVFRGFENAINPHINEPIQTSQSDANNIVVFQGFEKAVNSPLNNESQKQDNIMDDNDSIGLKYFKSAASKDCGSTHEKENDQNENKATKISRIQIIVKSQPKQEFSDCPTSAYSGSYRSCHSENFNTPPCIPSSSKETVSDSILWRGSLSSFQQTNSSRNYTSSPSKFLSPLKEDRFHSPIITRKINSETRSTETKCSESFGSVISISPNSIPDKLTTQTDSFHSGVNEDSNRGDVTEFISSDNNEYSTFGSPMFKSTPKSVNDLGLGFQDRSSNSFEGRCNPVLNTENCIKEQFLKCDNAYSENKKRKPTAIHAKPKHGYFSRKLSASNYSANHLESYSSQEHQDCHQAYLAQDMSVTSSSVNLIDFSDCSSPVNQSFCKWQYGEKQVNIDHIVKNNMEDHSLTEEPCSKRRKIDDESPNLFYHTGLRMSSNSTSSCNTAEIIEFEETLKRVQICDQRNSLKVRNCVDTESSNRKNVVTHVNQANMSIGGEEIVEEIVVEKMVDDSSLEDIHSNAQHRVKSSRALTKSKHNYISRSNTSSPSTKSFYSHIVYWSSSCSSPELSNGSISLNDNSNEHQEAHHKVHFSQSLYKTCGVQEDDSKSYFKSPISGTFVEGRNGRDSVVCKTSYISSNSWGSQHEVFSNEIDCVDGYWNVSSNEDDKFEDEASACMYSPGGLDNSDANTLKHIPSIVNSSEMSQCSNDLLRNEIHFSHSHRLRSSNSAEDSVNTESFKAVNSFESHYKCESPLSLSSPHMMCGSDMIHSLKYQGNKNNSKDNSENDSCSCKYGKMLQSSRQSYQNIIFHKEMDPQSSKSFQISMHEIESQSQDQSIPNRLKVQKSPNQMTLEYCNTSKDKVPLALSDAEKCALKDIPNLHERLSALEDKFESISFAKPNKDRTTDFECPCFNLVEGNTDSVIQNMTDDEKISMPHFYIHHS